MAKFVSCLGIVVVIAAVLAASAEAGPTTCVPFKGLSSKTEIRCVKVDNAPYERVRVESKKGEKVEFELALWLGPCTNQGTEYTKTRLATPGNAEFDLDATPKGQCRTVYIYNCKVNGDYVNCDEAFNVKRVVLQDINSQMV